MPAYTMYLLIHMPTFYVLRVPMYNEEIVEAFMSSLVAFAHGSLLFYNVVFIVTRSVTTLANKLLIFNYTLSAHCPTLTNITRQITPDAITIYRK